MIIIIMFGALLAFFASIMFIKNRPSQIFWVLMTGILFVGSTTLMTLNYSHHFGMQQVTTTTKKNVYSATGPTLPVALYQPIGTSGSEQVLLYKKSANQRKINHTAADENVTNKMKFTNTSQPVLTVKETRWQFKNNFYRYLFMWSGMQDNLVKQINTIEYPSSYVKVTPTQMKKLQRLLMASPSSTAAIRSYVTNRVQAEMAKNPDMSATKITQLTQQAQQEYQGQMLKQALQNLN